jgi:hypothetical protein
MKRYLEDASELDKESDTKKICHATGLEQLDQALDKLTGSGKASPSVVPSEKFDTREFKQGQDDFELEISNTVFQHIMKLTKDNVVGTICITKDYMSLTGMYLVGTVCISVVLYKESFQTFECKNPVSMNINLKVLSSEVDFVCNLNKGKTMRLCNNGLDFELISHNTRTQVKSLIEEPEKFDPAYYNYDVILSLPSDQFAQCIASMGEVFTIEMDTKHGCLRFTSSSETSCRKVALPISLTDLKEISKHPSISNYCTSFYKTHLTCMTGTSAITTKCIYTNRVMVGLKTDCPLFIEYILFAKVQNRISNSSVKIFISSKYDDDE